MNDLLSPKFQPAQNDLNASMAINNSGKLEPHGKRPPKRPFVCQLSSFAVACDLELPVSSRQDLSAWAELWKSRNSRNYGAE